MAYQALKQAHIDQFMEKGWCALEGCFSAQAAEQKRTRWIEEQGLDPASPQSWGFSMMHRGLKDHFLAKEFSPLAWAAAEDLMGKDRIERWTWGGFIVNVNLGADKPWQMPPKDNGGWHVDCDFFHHFLDSREQGMLSIQVFSDVESHGGATVVSEDSWQGGCQALFQHPEGLDPHQVNVETKKFAPFGAQRELTAKAGTVVFLHPFILHASSQNISGRVRFIMNAPPQLKDHMRFDDWDKASVVERSIIQALGGKPFEFKVQGERRMFTPDRTLYDKAKKP